MIRDPEPVRPVERFHAHCPARSGRSPATPSANELSFFRRARQRLPGGDGGHQGPPGVRHRSVLFHCSESRSGRTPTIHAAGVLQGPCPTCRTRVILESTANGVACFFMCDARGRVRHLDYAAIAVVALAGRIRKTPPGFCSSLRKRPRVSPPLRPRPRPDGVGRARARVGAIRPFSSPEYPRPRRGIPDVRGTTVSSRLRWSRAARQGRFAPDGRCSSFRSA